MKFWCCIAFLTIAIVSTASGQGRAINSDQTEEQAGITIPGTDFAVLLEMGEKRPTATLITAIETWLSTQFDLPAVRSHPRIELVPSEQIVACVTAGFCQMAELRRRSIIVRQYLLRVIRWPSILIRRRQYISRRAGQACNILYISSQSCHVLIKCKCSIDRIGLAGPRSPIGECACSRGNRFGQCTAASSIGHRTAASRACGSRP